MADVHLAKAREETLAKALASIAPGPVDVMSMKLAVGGNSRETWICDVNFAGGRRRVVFRCDPDHWIRPVEMRREINGLRLAQRARVPVPNVLVSTVELALERPYVVTEFIDGTTIARRIIRDSEYAGARAAFARQCGEILAHIHAATAFSKDWTAYEPLAELEEYFAASMSRSPVFAGALRWLKDTRPSMRRVACPIHRDFRLGNLMISSTGIVAVLDWETCSLGEPEEDIAWLCARSWRYGGPLPVGGLGRMEEFTKAYEENGGSPIDADRLVWWTVYAETRWGLAGSAQMRQGSPGQRMEQAAIARLACRQERYVLDVLGKLVKQ